MGVKIMLHTEFRAKGVKNLRSVTMNYRLQLLRIFLIYIFIYFVFVDDLNTKYETIESNQRN